jgi:hypothetical protein
MATHTLLIINLFINVWLHYLGATPLGINSGAYGATISRSSQLLLAVRPKADQ